MDHVISLFESVVFLMTQSMAIRNKMGEMIQPCLTPEITVNQSVSLLLSSPTSSNKLKVDGKEIKQVDKFIYLGSVVSTEDSAQKDIKNRLSKARTAFHKLRPIWKSNQYSRTSNIKLYNSNVKSVLLYGSECWRVTKTDMNSLSSFHHNCLKQICKIFWPNTITNTNLLKLTNSTCILNQIRQKRLRWFWHVLRMDRSSIPKIALRWTPAGKRPRGRPKTTWRKTIEN